jgi:hypothetical protein
MASDWINRRHIRIPSENVRRLPKKRRRPPPRKEGKKDSKQQGKMLLEQLETTVRFSERKEKVIADEDVFFVIHTVKPVSFEDNVLKRFSLRFSLQINERAAIVSINRRAVEKLKTDFKEYLETSKLKSYIDEIERISIVELEKISPELHEWLLSDLATYVEIEMLPNLGLENYSGVISKLIDFLKKHDATVLEHRIRDYTASVRAYLNPRTMKLIVQGMDSIWQARRAPSIVTEKPQSVELKEKPSPKLPPPDIKTICVLDTGVDQAQPFLRHILLDSVDLTNDGSSDDYDGHGTFVTGLAAYGNLENRSDPEASANIISVKVLGSNANQFTYLENKIEQAVQRFHDRAKIFNLSVMYPNYCDTSKPSDLAYTIDKLSKDYDVLFIVSSGNVKDDLDQLIHSMPYPTYLGNRECSIYQGAEASSAVTVGGIAHKYSDRAIAKVGQPSPFTRRGEFGKRNKPDVVSHAGNIEVSSSGSPYSNNRALGVASLGISPNTLAYGIGTSYSTPIVANILAKLSKEYPNASINLLKALVVHFAFWPEGHLTLNAGEQLKKALYGKGAPEFEKCAYSFNYSPAYVVEDSIGFDEVAFVPIYVPHIMKEIFGEKRIRVTLVYTPPVDLGVDGYTLVDLDFKLYKQTKRGEFKKQSRWDSSFRRTWDNVKTDVFRWQKTGWGMEWSLMIFPKVRFRDRIINGHDQVQNFAVVITLEDPGKRFNIYDAILNEQRRITKPLEAFIQSKKVPAS